VTAQTLYWDTSALMKLVATEKETPYLEPVWRQGGQFLTSILGKAELLRIATLAGPDELRRARELVAALTILKLDEPTVETAAGLPPAVLRTSDAIHVASALASPVPVDAVVTYDNRLQDACATAGLAVLAPAADLANKEYANPATRSAYSSTSTPSKGPVHGA
jgi:predicted nucleic acid-binding protein